MDAVWIGHSAFATEPIEQLGLLWMVDVTTFRMARAEWIINRFFHRFPEEVLTLEHLAVANSLDGSKISIQN